MSLCTSNLHPSSSSINLFFNNNTSPKPFLNSLRFATSTSSSSSVAPLKLSSTNHTLTSRFLSNRIQSRQLWLRCATSESEPSISVVPGGNGGAEERVIVLIIGGGGREHALCHALKRSPSCGSVLCAPGNPGITSSGDAACVPDLDVSDSSAVISFCRKQNVGLVVVGPEVPLVAGLADDLVNAGILTFGPSSQAAALEGSKNFMKDLCHKYNIPTAKVLLRSFPKGLKIVMKKEKKTYVDWIVNIVLIQIP